MKREVHLNRSKDRKITFMGEDLFDISDKDNYSSRWWRLQAYITDNGYNLGIGHVSTWTPGERDCYWAYKEIPTKEGIIRSLRNNTPPTPYPGNNAIRENPYMDLLYKVYEEGIPKTLIRDWEKERNAYINLVGEVERFLTKETSAPGSPHRQVK